MRNDEQLEDDVRALRPDMDKAFANSLERRVAAGFATEEPARAPARRLRRPKRQARRHPAGQEPSASSPARRWAPALGVALSALLALIVGVGVLRGAEEGGQTTATTERTAPEGGVTASGGTARTDASGVESSAQQSGDAPLSRVPLPSPAPPGRDVESTTSLTLAVPDREIQRVADEAVAVTDRLEGFTERASVEVGNGRAVADLTLRVPAERINDALAALSRLGDVRSRMQETLDLTEQVDSVQERLEDARALRDGLRQALTQAGSAREITDLRERLEDARRRVRSLGRERAELRERTRLATLAVTVEGTGGPPPATGSEEDGAWTPGDALRDGLAVLRVALGIVIVGGATALPLALLAALVALTLAAVRRRARERALDAV